MKSSNLTASKATLGPYIFPLYQELSCSIKNCSEMLIRWASGSDYKPSFKMLLQACLGVCFMDRHAAKTRLTKCLAQFQEAPSLGVRLHDVSRTPLGTQGLRDEAHTHES